MKTVLQRVRRHVTSLSEAVDRMVGLPNYERYLSHMQRSHPEQTPLSRAAFYDEAQRHRYESGSERPRCC